MKLFIVTHLLLLDMKYNHKLNKVCIYQLYLVLKNL